MAAERIDTSLEDETFISHLTGTLTFSDFASLDKTKSEPPNPTTLSSADEGEEDLLQNQRMITLPQAVRFEVIDARIVDDKGDKHVDYTILVMHSVGFDSMPGKIYKRYSELSSLRRELEQSHPSLMRNINFPSKRIVGNFSPSTLASRSRSFEKFLSSVFSIRELRFSKPFVRFLYGSSLLEGYKLMENGFYEKASDLLVASWKLQNKVVPTKSYQCLMTLVAVVASYCSYGNADQAQLFADLSIQSYPDIQKDFSVSNVIEPKWLVVILRTNVKLCRVLGKDCTRYETRLQDLRRKGISTEDGDNLLSMILHNKQLWHGIVEEGVGYG